MSFNVKCSSLEEVGEFDNFIKYLGNVEVTDRLISSNDWQLGNIKYQDENLFINDKKLERDCAYDIQPIIQNVLGE